MGEYVFDHGWAQALELRGGYYYPKLQGSVPFTPVTAPKLLVPSTASKSAPRCYRPPKACPPAQCVSSVHLTFLPDDDAATRHGVGLVELRRHPVSLAQ